MGVGVSIASWRARRRAAPPHPGQRRSASMRRARSGWRVPARVLAALVLFGVFIALTGRNPLEVYYQMYRGVVRDLVLVPEHAAAARRR